MTTPYMAGSPTEGHLLIIGAGLAGYHAARGARENGHTGPITILGDESLPAYDRPALSKAFLSGSVNIEDLALDDPDHPLDVTWIGGSSAVELSASPLGVHTADGTFHMADNIIIVTGAQASRLPFSGTRNPDVYVIRNVEDAMALRGCVAEGKKVTVVGGGFLALEAASTWVDRRAEVTVVAGEANPGTARLGQPVGCAIRALHEERGVRFADPARASAVETDDDTQVLRLADGTGIESDIVICAIGAAPSTAWLRGSALTLEPTTGAILCDDTGFTGVPGVWAAGDCAQWASQASGIRPIGHWQEAVEQAGIVSAALTGVPPAPFQEPYFWSEQYHVKIQAAGRLAQADQVQILDGTIEGGDLLLSYLKDGEEVGILGMNRLREVKRWRKLRQIKHRAALAA